MKPLLVITSSIFLCSCSSWKKPLSPPPVVLLDEIPKPLTDEQKKKIRSPEMLKKYAIGRYVDPSNGLIMHEAHDVYRVEATSKWNLRPRRSPSRIDNLQSDFSSTHQQVELEQLRRSLQQERATSRAAMKATQKMRDQIEPLAKSVSKAKALAEENATLRQQLRSHHQTPTLPLDPKNCSIESLDDSASVKERLRGFFNSNTTDK